MEKYTVKMGCGHESTVSLSGTQKECEDTIAYLERCGLCPQCYREGLEWQSDKWEVKKKKALFNATKNNLPELTGTEKQVEWAMVIRNTFFTAFLRALYKYQIQAEENGISEEKKNIILEDLAYIKKFFASKTDSRYWIVHRNSVLSYMISNSITRLADEVKELKEFETFFSAL